MTNDPIMDEIRQIREDFAKRFSYDIYAMGEYLRKRGGSHPDRLVSFPPKRPRPRRPVAREDQESLEDT